MTLRTLLFSTLYPSAIRPGHGIFVETRLRELLATGKVLTKVVAPVPWFFSKNPHFGEYARMASIPSREVHNGIDIRHPRYILLPKFGMNSAPHSMAMGALPAIKRLIRDGFDFDLIDAHYYYPDGVAAGIIAEKLGKPFVVTARGTDINLIPDFDYPRQLILKTAAKANASICVSKALAERLLTLGAPPEKIKVFRNGVDLERFQLEDKSVARAKLGLSEAPTLLSVGNLIELKGHHIAIEALTKLPSETQLVIAGIGPELAKLQNIAIQLSVENRVRFVGQVKNEELKWWYNATDTLVLCSSREGWANVLLEAMACGTPVVATPVGGTADIVANDEVGRLMSERSASALAAAYRDLQTANPNRNAIRKYAEQFSWQETSKNQIALFESMKNA